MVDTAYMKRYGYFSDDDYQEDIMAGCIESAKLYFANAGVPEPAADSATYDQGIAMLALHYYDHRGAVETGNQQYGMKEIPYGVNSIIHQLVDYTL